jgi:hypothetical protein
MPTINQEEFTMYPHNYFPKRKTAAERLRDGEAYRAMLDKQTAAEAERTRFKGPEPIQEAIVAYGAGLQPYFNDIRGDSTWSNAQICGKLEIAMHEIRDGFTERQKAYKTYEPTVVFVEEGRRGYFSLRLDGWEIGKIS